MRGNRMRSAPTLRPRKLPRVGVVARGGDVHGTRKVAVRVLGLLTRIEDAYLTFAGGRRESGEVGYIVGADLSVADERVNLTDGGSEGDCRCRSEPARGSPRRSGRLFHRSSVNGTPH